MVCFKLCWLLSEENLNCFTAQAYNAAMKGNQQLKFNYEAIVPVSIQVPRQPDPAQLH